MKLLRVDTVSIQVSSGSGGTKGLSGPRRSAHRARGHRSPDGPGRHAEDARDDHPPPARAQQVAGREEQRQEDDEDPDRGDEPRGGDPRGRHEQRPVPAGRERRAFVFARREADTREHARHQEEPADHVLRTSGRQDRADQAEVRRQEKEDQEERDRLNVAAEQGRSGLDRSGTSATTAIEVRTSVATRARRDRGSRARERPVIAITAASSRSRCSLWQRRSRSFRECYDAGNSRAERILPAPGSRRPRIRRGQLVRAGINQARRPDWRCGDYGCRVRAGR